MIQLDRKSQVAGKAPRHQHRHQLNHNRPTTTNQPTPLPSTRTVIISPPANDTQATNSAELSAGVLDFDLGEADSTAVCWKLCDRRIPFVLHSGRFYSAFKQWPSAPVVFKPAGKGLIATVAGLFR
jgi:hypothetical protein